MATAATQPGADTQSVGALGVVPFLHPQGCRTYLLADPVSRQAAVVDPHLDLSEAVAARVEAEGWTLPYVVDTHTHADHPSAAGLLAARFGSTRIAHALAEHAGVTRHPADGEALHLGDVPLTVRHAPGHTPDHIVLLADGALFAGDTLFIEGVARTDFLGGDAGVLFDTLHALLAELPDETRLYPGHDYAGRTASTIGHERSHNPWLQIQDRATFARQLEANPPPRPANMDDLLRLNREGVDIPSTIPITDAIDRARRGGALSIVDVRTGLEVAAEHVDGSRHVPLESIAARADDVRAVPAPRLLLCRSGNRAEMAAKALAAEGVGGLMVIEGGIEAWRSAGGDTVKGKATMSLERQVRIIAGALVLLGALLGLLVHPAFLALVLFVSAGQVFAGVTDWCGMGLLLAKAPWNRGGGMPDAPDAGGCAATAPGGCAATAPPDAGGCAANLPE